MVAPVPCRCKALHETSSDLPKGTRLCLVRGPYHERVFFCPQTGIVANWPQLQGCTRKAEAVRLRGTTTTTGACVLCSEQGEMASVHFRESESEYGWTGAILYPAHRHTGVRHVRAGLISFSVGALHLNPVCDERRRHLILDGDDPSSKATPPHKGCVVAAPVT